jgi:exosortase D (VPLPA-CTERM-specific)
MTTLDTLPAKSWQRNPLPLVLAVLAAIIICVLYWEAIGNLWLRWSRDNELSHSFFLPLITGWIIWTNRDVVKSSVGDPSILGALVIGVGLSMLLLGQLTSIFVIQHLGLVVIIAGAVAAIGGMSLLRVAAIPVSFLLFAVPPPYWFVTVLSWQFKAMSSVLGVAMLELMGVPAFLSGNIIDLGETKLQVAEACSGLRYLFPFLSIGAIAAFMYRGPIWHKIIIVLATIPITIVMNSFRIAVTGLLVDRFGSEHAEGALHFFEGWVVFVICLVLLFGVVALLCLISKPKKNPLDALIQPELRAVTPSRNKIKPPVVAATALAFAVATLGLSQVVKVDELITPDRDMFVGIPGEFEGWNTEIRPIDPSVAETLGADDSIVVNMTTPDGETAFNLYMAYLNAQRDGRSWHSPRQCIPGGGWKIVSHNIVPAQTDRSNFKINRMIIQNGENRQLVYYWYDQRGRKVANEFVMKFWLIADAVTKKRTDGAMVRLITPIPNTASIEEVESKLDDLLNKVDTFLPAYVPE